VMDADRERITRTISSGDLLMKARLASETEGKFKLAQAEANLAKAKLARLIADSKKAADADKKLKSAMEALEKVRNECASP